MSIVEIRSIDGLGDFIAGLSSDPDYSDPHFSRDRGNLYGAFQRERHRGFVVRGDGGISGLFIWLIMPGERYIELIVGLSRDPDAWGDMLDWLEGSYPGCQVDFVINPRNPAARCALDSRRAAFDPEQVWMRWKKAVPCPCEGQIEACSARWREPYHLLHRTDTYWTADKVLDAADRFSVLVAVREDRLIGYIDVTHGLEENEPYDLFVVEEYAHRGYEQALLAEAARRNQPARMSALVYRDEIGTYAAAGFEAVEGCDSVFATYRTPEKK